MVSLKIDVQVAMFYGEGEELPYNNIEELIPFFFF